MPGTASSSSRDARQEPVGRAEVLEQRALADRADAAQPVEDRGRHRLAAAPAMEVEREAMRLVADPLQQPQGLRVHARIGSGRGAPGR